MIHSATLMEEMRSNTASKPLQRHSKCTRKKRQPLVASGQVLWNQRPWTGLVLIQFWFQFYPSSIQLTQSSDWKIFPIFFFFFESQFKIEWITNSGLIQFKERTNGTSPPKTVQVQLKPQTVDWFWYWVWHGQIYMEVQSPQYINKIKFNFALNCWPSPNKPIFKFLSKLTQNFPFKFK